jgi:hypothetical protein
MGLQQPSKSISTDSGEAALIMRGFARVKGELALTYIARVFDEDGQPMGYRALTGGGLLFNPEHKKAFATLPDFFKHKQARMQLRKGDSSTGLFLDKCVALKILKKLPGRDGYQKLIPKEGRSS